MENAKYFRSEREKNGFNFAGKAHAIIPVMLYDAVLSQKVAEKMLEKEIYVTGFFYPVVPKGKEAYSHANVGGTQQKRY